MQKGNCVINLMATYEEINIYPPTALQNTTTVTMVEGIRDHLIELLLNGSSRVGIKAKVEEIENY